MVTVLLVALSGCRGLPSSVGAATEAMLMPSFTHGQLLFHSDFDVPRDHRLLRALAAERDEIGAALQLDMPEEPIHVYLFANEAAHRRHITENFPGVPHRRALFVESAAKLSVYAPWGEHVAQDLRHEVAHGYLHAAVEDLPLWLDEGLAEYFEVAGGQRGLNRPHAELLVDMIRHNGWRPNLQHLEQLSSISEMSQQHYAEAWAWVHFLLESSPERRSVLQDYLAELRDEGESEPLSERLARELTQAEETLCEHILAIHGED